MNKKFFGFLLGFAALLSVGTLQSCKDTNDDLDAEIHGVSSNLSALEQRVNTLEGYDIPAMKTKLDAIKNCICEAENCKWDEERIKGIEKEVEALQKAVVILQNSPTGVTVQSVYTPAIGTLNTPFGINNNVLVVYKGEDQGAPLVSAPGKLYLTVDPLNVNYSDVDSELGLIKTKLVNSKGEAAPIALSALKVSDDVLKLGYTRANNYLYETTASVDNVDALESLSFDKAGLAEAVKDIINYKDGVNFTELANLVLNTVNQKLTANAVEIEYVDKDNESHSVVSKYQIGAVAVTPLNLTSFDAISSLKPAAEKAVVKVANKVASAVQNRIKARVGDKLVNLTVKDITLGDLSEGTFPVTIPAGQIVVNGSIDLWSTDQTTVNVILTGGSTLTLNKTQSGTFTNPSPVIINVNKSDLGLEDMIDLDDINDMVAQVNNYIKKVNNAYTKVVAPHSSLISSAVETIFNKAWAGVEKLANGVNPVLVAVVDGKAQVLSQIESMPTVVPAGAEITIVPTSWTGEYIVPFYSKKVDATGATVSYDPAESYTGTMTVSGKAEITYKVLDYAGNADARTYYVVAE